MLNVFTIIPPPVAVLEPTVKTPLVEHKVEAVVEVMFPVTASPLVLIRARSVYVIAFTFPPVPIGAE